MEDELPMNVNVVIQPKPPWTAQSGIGRAGLLSGVTEMPN
jgi:hypothetical protein